MTDLAINKSRAAGIDEWLSRSKRLIEQRFGDCLVVLSPPRSGSTPVARMLWETAAFAAGYHCHEPFEARYWGGADGSSVFDALKRPMCVASGDWVDIDTLKGRPSLVLKEMCFQLDKPAFEFLAAVTTRPIVFVVRDPRLSIVSRLRIVRELDGSTTFPPEHSGWEALIKQINRCRKLNIHYVIVDSQRLRQEPEAQAMALLERLGIMPTKRVVQWRPRAGLQLCSPEVGALMSSVRTDSDPFYRRVLASVGIEPPDDLHDEDLDRQISAAGLERQAAAWCLDYQELRSDLRML